MSYNIYSETAWEYGLKSEKLALQWLMTKMPEATFTSTNAFSHEDYKGIDIVGQYKGKTIKIQVKSSYAAAMKWIHSFKGDISDYVVLVVSNSNIYTVD